VRLIVRVVMIDCWSCDDGLFALNRSPRTVTLFYFILFNYILKDLCQARCRERQRKEGRKKRE